MYLYKQVYIFTAQKQELKFIYIRRPFATKIFIEANSIKKYKKSFSQNIYIQI